MKKGIVAVFIIIGILVIALILWGVVFNGGGFAAAIDAVVTPINNIWLSMTGGSSKLISIEINDMNQNQISTAGNKTFGNKLANNGSLQ